MIHYANANANFKYPVEMAYVYNHTRERHGTSLLARHILCMFANIVQRNLFLLRYPKNVIECFLSLVVL